jgi:ABC-type nitrate/sulfonate/bicarbonate transport system ATPase subunit
MIQVQSITFGYSPARPIFRDFSWQVEDGDAWAVLGTSGCGKTTLLYLLAGLYFPSEGRITFNGQPLTRPRPHTGLILQDYGLLPWATVRENAGLGLSVRKFYGPDGTHAPRENPATVNASAWLERLGLSPVAQHYPAQLSGGQRQRTAIARTLALDPDLLLMDEPFSSLDAITREDLQQLSMELCTEQHITMVIVTHAIEEAALLGKKILVLGTPPHTAPVILENPGAWTEHFNQSPAYQQMCQTLRERLEAQ